MRPKNINRISPTEVKIIWDDGKETIHTMERLRDNCPCAGCSGETVLLREYRPPEPDRQATGRYELKAIQPVGSYALQFTWGDGHNTGIYTFEVLRNLPP
jgi:DUF971 family protein